MAGDTPEQMAQGFLDEQGQREIVGQWAANQVQDGQVVGLGSGSTAAAAVRALAQRVRQGLMFTGIPTSEPTADLARSLAISLSTLEEHPELDLGIDGADEVDEHLNLIKGRGGALLREKIVELSCKQLLIIITESKLSPRLGQRSPVPVEVIPFGWQHTRKLLEKLGATTTLRLGIYGTSPYLTDGGHYILDCRFPEIASLATLAANIKALTGVVEHGLFLGMASAVIVGQRQGGVRVLGANP